MAEIRKTYLKPADCALDMGDGSERGLYVNQDYILQKLRKVHRGISLMYTYYPTDEGWPGRASVVHKHNVSGAWDYPYEDYFPYKGGLNGNREDEPFNFMKEIRQHGMDVVLTMTINPHLEDEYLVSVAKDLRSYGRVLLRINHECTGNWFCYTKRATYPEIADFFVRFNKILKEYAPNVKTILCAGMWEKHTGKLEMEDIFLEAHKVADYWSGDNYLALHWGWPVDICTKETNSHACYDVDEIYEKAKNTYKRLKEITGQDKPFVLSELNADGDVTGAFEQSNMMRHFMERLEQDDEKWLSAFTFYQFRDDGRLGLEITDPNNSDVGIEQPMMQMYKEKIQSPFFSAKMESGEEISLPCKLRWGGAEDAEGVEGPLHFEKTPTFAELYFDEELIDLTMMIELGGYWFYKKAGTKCVDMMSLFFEKPLSKPTDMKLRFFLPPQDGMNYPEKGNADDAPNGDWMVNCYNVLPKLPTIRIENDPVALAKKYY